MLQLKAKTVKLSTPDEPISSKPKVISWAPWATVISSLPVSPPDVLAVDTETTGLSWSKDAGPFAISLAWYNKDDLKTAYFQVPVNPYSRYPLDKRWRDPKLNLLGLWLCNKDTKKIFANAKYDMHMLEKVGFRIAGPIYDVLIAAWCCNTLETSYKLNNLAEKYLGVDQKDEKYLREMTIKARSKAKKLGYNIHENVANDYWFCSEIFPELDIVKPYAIKDAGVRTLDLWYYYEEAMEELGVRETFDMEMATMRVLYKMEERGIRFFEEKCVDKIGLLDKEAERYEFEIKHILGKPDLNINSPKQMVKVLYNDLELPITKTTPSGEPSTDVKTLERHAKVNPVVQQILEFRGLNTGKRYLKNYLEHKVADDELSLHDLPFLHEMQAMHPNFNQIAASALGENKARTGRLTSSNPNLQNVPDESKSSGFNVIDGREYFGPRNGYRWYCIDYSQIELRIFAYRSKGQLYEAFKAGRDPHDETRRAVPYLAAMDEKRGRKIAKNTNFTVINCGGAGVLYEKYGVPLDEGKKVIKEFYEQFPESKARQREAEKFAIQHGYIETISGRKINVDLSTKHGHFIYAYRATSYDIQGSAADIIKRAMVRLHDYFSSIDSDVHLVLSIHDELVIEVKEEHCFKWLLEEIKSIMEDNSDWIDLPTPVEIERTTTNWGTKERQEVKLC